MRKPLPKSEKKVRIWSDVEPELKHQAKKKADAALGEKRGNLSAWIRILIKENV